MNLRNNNLIFYTTFKTNVSKSGFLRIVKSVGGKT